MLRSAIRAVREPRHVLSSRELCYKPRFRTLLLLPGTCATLYANMEGARGTRPAMRSRSRWPWLVMRRPLTGCFSTKPMVSSCCRMWRMSPPLARQKCSGTAPCTGRQATSHRCSFLSGLVGFHRPGSLHTWCPSAPTQARTLSSVQTGACNKCLPLMAYHFSLRFPASRGKESLKATISQTTFGTSCS